MQPCERCGYALGPGWRACPACGHPIAARPAPLPPRSVDDTVRLDETMVLSALTEPTQATAVFPGAVAPPAPPPMAASTLAPPAIGGDPRARLLAYVVAAAFVLGIIVALLVEH